MSEHSLGLPLGETGVKREESSYSNYQGEVENVLKGSDFITEREGKIIRDMYSENISENVIQIVEEFRRRIFENENMSSSASLLEQVCNDLLLVKGKQPDFYFKITCYVLTQLSDKDLIGPFLVNGQKMPSNVVKEFRRKWGGENEQGKGTQQSSRLKVKTQESRLEGDEKTPEQTVKLHIKTEQPKIFMQKQVEEYPPIDGEAYYNKFGSFKKTDSLKTDVPLLEEKDIAVSYYGHGYTTLTSNTNVPNFDVRDALGKLQKEFNSNIYYIDNRNDNIEVEYGNVYSLYNKEDGVSHIIVFGSNSGTVGSLNIGIRGVVSQRDGEKLVKSLIKQGLIAFNGFNHTLIRKKGERENSLYGAKIQEAVIDYFNNGEYEKE